MKKETMSQSKESEITPTKKIVDYSFNRLIPPPANQIAKSYFLRIGLETAFLMLAALPLLIVWGTVSTFVSGIHYLIRGPKIRKRMLSEINQESTKTNKEISDKVRAIPFTPRPIPSRLVTTLAYLPDMVNYLLDSKSATRCAFYPYPKSFQMATIPLSQNIKHRVSLGIHPGPARPTIILVHGLFNTKNHAMQRRIAMFIYEKMGYNVAIPDLRDFGETSEIENAPIFGSYQEGQDMVELALRLKKEFNASSVGLMGYSFGGATAMQAAYHNQENAIDGGIIAFNGFSEMELAIKHIDSKPPILDEFFPVYLFFKWTFLSRVRERYKKTDIRSFHDYIRKVVLPFYGGNINDYYNKNSVLYKAKLIDTPVLIIHAEDDPVVLSEHAHYMTPISLRNGNIQVIITPKGGHYGYWILSPQWLKDVIRTYFTYWNE